MKYKLINGNSLDILKTIEDNTFDSIVTDPPYELGFKGKSWDSTGISFNKELWAECLRVLKPGGHLIAFSGSRTYHRIAVAIEDAGFEIRDQIMWVYSSGFPKGLDVSKAIDKLDAKEEKQKRNYKFTEWMRSTGLTIKKINEITSTNMGSHYIAHLNQPSIPTRQYFELLRPFINIDVPNWIEDLINERTIESENIKNREVVGTSKNFGKISENTPFVGSNEWNITTPSTPDAKQWQGWGTALKPAHEPIVLARKPLSEKTVAENVLKLGTGAINIDGCRIETNDNLARVNKSDNGMFGVGNNNNKAQQLKENGIEYGGRWPANLIHDGLKTEWAKFFYCPKLSKKDRNEGCENIKPKLQEAANYRPHQMEEALNGENGDAYGRYKPQSNNHPTVKPTDLMAYLVRLVTPPGGTVLDPFNGSGSTGKACAREGFEYVGIDLSQEYLDISKARIEHELSKKK